MLIDNDIIFKYKYVQECAGMLRTVQECFKIFFFLIFFSLWTKIVDYTVNLSWGTEGSKSASTSRGATTSPSAFTTFINSPEGDSFR